VAAAAVVGGGRRGVGGRYGRLGHGGDGHDGGVGRRASRGGCAGAAVWVRGRGGDERARRLWGPADGWRFKRKERREK
jgi:hypothetical protein